MPDVTGDPNTPYRLLVDETSFDFRALEADRLTELLDDFNDALEESLRGRPVGLAPWWYEHNCLEGCELGDFLWTSDSLGACISRDTRLRMAKLMDRCHSWEPEPDSDIPDKVVVAGHTRELAYSLGYALSRTLAGHTMACIVFPAGPLPNGWHATQSPMTEAAEIYFLRTASDLPKFFRGVLKREFVPEELFLTLAIDAFPNLVFNSSLSFGKFKGSYREVYDWVIDVLTTINENFSILVHKYKGESSKVKARLSQLGINASPESPNTHRDRQAMRQRYVKCEEDGVVYRCEWHAKRHPLHDRIHFSLPEPQLGGRIFVGVFVDHLS